MRRSGFSIRGGCRFRDGRDARRAVDSAEASAPLPSSWTSPVVEGVDSLPQGRLPAVVPRCVHRVGKVARQQNQGHHSRKGTCVLVAARHAASLLLLDARGRKRRGADRVGLVRGRQASRAHHLALQRGERACEGGVGLPRGVAKVRVWHRLWKRMVRAACVDCRRP